LVHCRSMRATDSGDCTSLAADDVNARARDEALALALGVGRRGRSNRPLQIRCDSVAKQYDRAATCTGDIKGRPAPNTPPREE
jgi:hypothetical protein